MNTRQIGSWFCFLLAVAISGARTAAQSPPPAGKPHSVTLPAGFRILQPLASEPKKMTDPQLGDIYYIPNMLSHVRWGVLPNRDAKPIVTVPSGSLVQFDLISHEGVLEDQGRDPVKFFGGHGIRAHDVLEDAKAVAASAIAHDFDRDGPHVISPPVGIAGAEPGDVLRVDVLRLEPRVPYGVNSIRHGKGALPEEYPRTPPSERGADAAHPDRYHNVSFVVPIRPWNGGWYAVFDNGSGREARIPVRPFVGTMGVAQDTSERPNSVPPGPYGGNLDLRNLTAGATLYLPVLVPGAQFFASDPHFAQGDGEVSLTAIEGSLRATLRLTLLKRGDPRIPVETPLAMPFAETAEYWIPIGIAPRLDAAMQECVRQAIAFLTHNLGFQPDNALSFLSMAADFEISEVVDRNQEVHALIPKADFPGYRSNGK